MLPVWGAYIWRAYTWRGLFSEFYGMLERVQALYTTSPFSMQPSLNLPTTRLNKCSLRSWRYCVGARLKFWRQSHVPKKGSRDKVVEISRCFATRDGSIIKSYSTILQPLRRQISLDYYTIPPATRATTNVRPFDDWLFYPSNGDRLHVVDLTWFFVTIPYM